MPHIEGEIVINRPVEEVFAFVADERNEPRYNPRMLSVQQTSSGPVGVGTRWRAEMATMRRSMPMTIDVTAYEPPRRLSSSTHLSTMEIEGALSFESVPQGTRMRWQWDLRPRGLLKLVKPLVARMGQRQEQATWANLKRVLEAPAAAASRPPRP